MCPQSCPTFTLHLQQVLVPPGSPWATAKPWLSSSQGTCSGTVGHLVSSLWGVPPHLVSFSFEELALDKLTGLADLKGVTLVWAFLSFSVSSAV